MNLSEKAAYIKGLAEGLELDTDKKEARVINELLDLVSEMASDVEDIGADLVDLYDAFEELDRDLGMVEEELYGDMDTLFSDDVYEIVCPNCQESVVLDEEMLIGGDVICPGCGEKIEIEIDTCDCGHDHDM
ncbi:TFIIB-type zinc ribbon-containing protein [Ruminococcaceae bacterium OttesenSCG-928-I18]|nr:TFIIB-type zinc ribbon-containing protein [Ruminococcaceae bacterium OttesenSCG-928-I18]